MEREGSGHSFPLPHGTKSMRRGNHGQVLKAGAGMGHVPGVGVTARPS